VNDLCSRIAAGEVRLALLAGAEAISTVRHLAAQGNRPDFREDIAGTVEDQGRGLRGLVKLYHRTYGLTGAPPSYALFENARRGRRGETRADYAAEMANLFAPFARIAAANRYSASAVPAYTASELIQVSERNRMIADPYPRLLVARDQVNQSAALLLSSVGTARALGIPPEKYVYLHGYAELIERDILERVDIGSSPAAQMASKAALAAANVSVDEISMFDFYSCFPIAVSNVACDAFGLTADDPRGLTVTGGLPFFGGPGNNYSMHAIATMVEQLRARPGTYGFVGANGGFMSKYAAGVYSTRPAVWRASDVSELQGQIDARVAPPIAHEADGAGKIETYTVVYRKGEPDYAIAIGRLDGTDERFIARTPEDDRSTVECMVAEDPIGQPVLLCSSGRGNRFALTKETAMARRPQKPTNLRASYEYCRTEQHGPVLEITINRPEVKNALHPMANEELAEIMDVFLGTEDLWIAILTGAGTEAFCTGNDLKYSASGKAQWTPKTGYAGLTRRRKRTKPVIAAVNGYALGGGLEICLACDLIVVDEAAQLGLPEVQVGLIAGAGGLVRLPRQIPKKIATEMALTGARIDARRAMELGLVNRVTPAGKALEGARELAATMLACSPTSLKLSLRVMNESDEFPSEIGAIEAPSTAIDELISSDDMHEGIRAFVEKRKPRWVGR
jgi:acetyl-CoA C-acetyltransferase